MHSLNSDMVFWGVIICLVGTIAVIGWLFFMAFRNATKDKDKQ